MSITFSSVKVVKLQGFYCQMSQISVYKLISLKKKKKPKQQNDSTKIISDVVLLKIKMQKHKLEF